MHHQILTATSWNGYISRRGKWEVRRVTWNEVAALYIRYIFFRFSGERFAKSVSFFLAFRGVNEESNKNKIWESFLLVREKLGILGDKYFQTLVFHGNFMKILGNILPCFRFFQEWTRYSENIYEWRQFRVWLRIFDRIFIKTI